MANVVRGVSAQKRLIAGIYFAYTRAFGSIPRDDADEKNQSKFEAFVRRSATIAAAQTDDADYQYVMEVDDGAPLRAAGEARVARKGANATFRGDYWDTDSIGRVYKNGSRWLVEWNKGTPEREAAEKAAKTSAKAEAETETA